MKDKRRCNFIVDSSIVEHNGVDWVLIIMTSKGGNKVITSLITASNEQNCRCNNT